MARGDELIRERISASNRGSSSGQSPQDLEERMARYFERYMSPLRRQFDQLAEKVGLLTGERGDGSQRALTPTNPGDTSTGGGGDTIVITNPPPDAVTPTQPQHVTATGGFTHIIVQWDAANYTGHKHTEIWRNTLDDFGTATRIDTTEASIYSDTVDLNSKFYYWVRFVNLRDEPGAVSLSAYAETAINISAEMQRISDLINSGQLAQALQDRINLIDTPVTGLLDKLAAESIARQQGDSQLQTQIESIVLSNIADVYYQPDMPTGAIAENSRWFDTNDGNRPYLYKGGTWVDISDQRILDVSAATVTEQAARIAADSAQADQISAIQAQISNPSTGLSALATSLSSVSSAVTTQGSQLTANTNSLNQIQAIVGSNYAALQTMYNVTVGPQGLSAQLVFKTDVNGYIAGWGLWNTGVTSQAIFNVDDFAIGKSGASTVYPFIVSGGVVYMKTAMIQTASIVSGQIQSLVVDKIVGDTASFVINNIGTASIDFAKIQNNIQSGNYVAGATGWRIDKTGWAEFRNVIVRGDVEASSLKANTLMVRTANIFDFSVETLKIAGNAVTVMVGSQAGAGPCFAAINVSAGDIPVGSTTVPIIINISRHQGSTCYFALAVSKDGGAYTTLFNSLPTGGVWAYTYIYNASPGSYTFKNFDIGNSYPGVLNNSITATLGKR